MTQLLWARQWGAFGTPSLKGKSQIWLLESRESSCGSKRLLPGRNWGLWWRELTGRDLGKRNNLPLYSLLLIACSCFPLARPYWKQKGRDLADVIGLHGIWFSLLYPPVPSEHAITVINWNELSLETMSFQFTLFPLHIHVTFSRVRQLCKCYDLVLFSPHGIGAYVASPLLSGKQGHPDNCQNLQYFTQYIYSFVWAFTKLSTT